MGQFGGDMGGQGGGDSGVAQSDAPAEGEVQAGGDAGEGQIGGGAPADDWKPPSREEYEAMRGDADVGREFKPHAEQIREALRAGLTPRDAQAAVKEAKATGQTVKAVLADWEEDQGKYHEMWKNFEKGPKYFKDAVGHVAQSQFAPHVEKQTALEKQVAELKAQYGELYGHAVLQQQATLKDPKWASVEKDALALVRAGKIPNVQLAREYVEQKRELAKMRAASGGAAQGAPPAAAGGKRVPAKPRNDPAMRGSTTPRGEGRSAPGGAVARNKNESSVEYAFRKMKADRTG